MTAPQDPRTTPLQDDEVALARVLRALPAGEPPAALDAAILKAATDAVAPTVAPRRRVRRDAAAWLPTWAIGTAAAAVLAVGIGTQLRPSMAPERGIAPPPSHEAAEAPASVEVDFAQRSERVIEPTYPPPAPGDAEPAPRRMPPPPPPPPPPAPEPLPQPQAAAPAPVTPAPAPVAEAAAADDSLDAIVVSGTRIDADTAEPAAGRRAQVTIDRSAAEERARLRNENAERRAREVSLGAAAAKARDEAARAAAAQSIPAPEEAESIAPAQTADAFAPAPSEAPAPAAAAPAPAAPPAGLAGGAPRAFADAAVLPPVADDRRLPAADWLERIRERQRQGDRAGARASLDLFVEAHPDVALPSDLARLR